MQSSMTNLPNSGEGEQSLKNAYWLILVNCVAHTSKSPFTTSGLSKTFTRKEEGKNHAGCK